MNARVVIDESDTHQLWIELRRTGSEVLWFAVFAAILLATLLTSLPGVEDTPGVLLAMLGITGGWSLVAVTGRETYRLDTGRRLIDVTIQSGMSRRRRQIDVSTVRAVRITTDSSDDDRRVVELVAADGTVSLRLPWHLTTLRAHDYHEVGRVLAERLAVPLCEIATTESIDSRLGPRESAPRRASVSIRSR